MNGVLTKGLLDFGKSFWKSQAVEVGVGASDEVEATAGKFGIGFFAVFLLGSDVQVESRFYDRGLSDVLTLDFTGLSHRPIAVRGAQPGFSSDMSTRVTVSIPEHEIPRGFAPSSERDKLRPTKLSNQQRPYDLFDYCRRLTCTSNAEISFIDNIGDRSFNHEGRWEQISSDKLFNDLLLGPLYGESTLATVSDYNPLIGDIFDGDKLVGRAAIDLDDDGSSEYLRVGGLTYKKGREAQPTSTLARYIPSYIGIMDGRVEIATRSVAMNAVSRAALAAWATEQARVGATSGLSTVEQMTLAHEVFRTGGDPGQLPFAYLRGKLVDLEQLKDFLEKHGKISVPISSIEPRTAEWVSIENAGTSFLLDKVDGPICILQPSGRPDLFDYQSSEYIDEIRPGSRLGAEVIEDLDFCSNDIIFFVMQKSMKDCVLVLESIAVFAVGRSSIRTQAVLTIDAN